MTQAAPAAPPHPRQLCQMTDCPHLRRQRKHHWVSLILVVLAGVMAYFVPPSPVWHTTTLGLVAAYIGVNMLPPVRRYFGFGQHTPQPDEREALIDAYAQVSTMQLLRHFLLPVALVLTLMVASDNKALVYSLIALYTIVLYAPKAFIRFFYKTRM